MTPNSERFNASLKHLTILEEKYPKVWIASEIGQIIKAMSDPLSPIYDNETIYKKYLKRLDKLLEKLWHNSTS